LRQNYRITHWQFDEPRQTHSTPSFEGETIEACDEQAIEHFRTISDQPENEWEGMDIVRIDVPAVAEQTTFLVRNGRQEMGVG